MGYPGRQNIYEAIIRRMVTQAMAEQELQFRQEHESDTDVTLLSMLHEWAKENGRTPWPEEWTGGSYLAERFGTWERAVELAGLSAPIHPRRWQSFDRIRKETEHQKALYRVKKAEKKRLAQKRLAQQAAKRRERENR